MRENIQRIAGNAGRYCPWFAALGSIRSADPGTLVIMSTVAPLAEKYAAPVRTKKQKELLKIACVPVVIVIIAFAYNKFMKSSVDTSKLSIAAIKEKLTLPTKPVKVKIAIVKGKSAKIRVKPSKDSSILTRAPYNTQMALLSEDGDWLKVKINSGDVGWVHKSVIEVTQERGK